MEKKLSRKALYIRIKYLCEDAGMDREDRMEFARHALDGKGYGYIKSLSDVSDEDLRLLFDMLQGWRLVQRIRWHNQALIVEAGLVMKKLEEDAFQAAARQEETGAWD